MPCRRSWRRGCPRSGRRPHWHGGERIKRAGGQQQAEGEPLGARRPPPGRPGPRHRRDRCASFGNCGGLAAAICGSTTLEGAERGAFDTLEKLAVLLDNSLVQQHPMGAEEEPRFTMLETLRE
jgi:hypothetical protein